MKLLLDDRLAPLTSEYGFVECAEETVASWFREWETKTQQSRGVTVNSRRVSGKLEKLLRSLEPLTTIECRRFLFVQTRSTWTAYFDNGAQGADAASLSYVARELGCRAVRVVAVIDTDHFDPKRGRYGGTILEVYGPKKTEFLNYVRTIGVVNDGGVWSFDQSGTPFEFEEPRHYRARATRNRFPLELLARYLEQLGIRAFDEEFFEERGMLLERSGPSAVGIREFTLEQVQSAGVSEDGR